MKDRLLDLLSREEEEESHGEDVVRAAFNASLVNLLHSVPCVSGECRLRVISLLLVIHSKHIRTPAHKHRARTLAILKLCSDWQYNGSLWEKALLFAFFDCCQPVHSLILTNLNHYILLYSLRTKIKSLDLHAQSFDTLFSVVDQLQTSLKALTFGIRQRI